MKDYGVDIGSASQGLEMEANDIVSVEKITEDANALLNQLAASRRDVILLRHRLQSIGQLTPNAIASLNRADEEFRASIERVRKICALQVDTITRLTALEPGD